MRFDAGEGDLGRNVLLGHDRDLGDEMRGELLPPVPGQCRLPPDRGIGRVQADVVGREDVALLGLVEDREEVRPGIGEDPLSPAAEGPVDLRLPGEEDPAQDQARAALRVRLGVGEAERGAPGAAEDEPLRKAQALPDPLRIGHEIGRRVLPGLAERGGAARAALVEEDDPPERRVEEAAVEREIPAPGPPWKKITGGP